MCPSPRCNPTCLQHRLVQFGTIIEQNVGHLIFEHFSEKNNFDFGGKMYVSTPNNSKLDLKDVKIDKKDKIPLKRAKFHHIVAKFIF